MFQRCGKVCFRSEKDVEFHIARMRRTAKKSRPARAYYCVRCSSWHITSQDDGTAVLKIQIAALKKENQLLRQGVDRDIQIAVNRDELIVKLHQKIAEKNKRISSQRRMISDLIAKYSSYITGKTQDRN